MSRDHFVWWQGAPRPTREHLHALLEDYFGAFAETIEWRATSGRFFVTLVGAPSFALRRQLGVTDAVIAARAELAVNPDGTPAPRCFEVFLGDDGIDVITRFADEATNALAHDFAAHCARRWNGRLDAG